MKYVYFIFSAMLLFPISAQAACSDGYWGSGGSCYPCYAGCKTCSGGNPNQCTSCYSGAFLVSESNPNNSACKGCSELHSVANGYCTSCTRTSCNAVSCYSGYYKSGSTSCSVCPQGCKTCSSASTCTSCSDGYSLNNGSCQKEQDLSKCLLISHPDPVTQPNGTVKCSCNSSSCGTGGTCQPNESYNSMVPSTMWGTCICKSGYYLDSVLQSCKSCPQGCTTCSSASSCSSCNSGYTLNNGVCQKEESGTINGNCPADMTMSADKCCCNF